ncbi:MAG: glycosyltransferase [Bacteroidales bacterium]
MKKILHIPKFFPPHNGGIEDVCKTIVDVLAEVNIEQKIICFNDTPKTQIDVYNNIEIVRVGVWKKIASQSISFAYFKQLKKLITQFKPNYIHFHTPNPFVALLLVLIIPRSTKLIVHWHSDIIAQKFLYLLVKPIERRILMRAHKIITTSLPYAQHSRPLSPFLHKARMIQNTINQNNFQLTNFVQNRVTEIKNLYKEKPLVLFIGRHVAYKGIEFLLQAAAKVHSDVVFLIGGAGTLTKYLITKNQLTNVHFIGRISEVDLAAYYYAADIFLFPSITKNEAFGIALAEAMYCKTASITFTIEGSGVNWVNLKDTTGLEVENSNVEALAKAIDCLIDNPEQRKIFAKNAKSRVEDLFIVDRIKEDIIELYADE